MQKITPKNVLGIIEKAQRRSFLLNPFFLIMNCEYEEADEILVYLEKDFLLFPPKNSRHLAHRKVWCYAEDIERIKKSGVEIKNITPDSTDYFYLTKNYLTFPGHNFQKMRKEIRFFERNYDFEILENYPAEKTKEFIHQWYARNLVKKNPKNREMFENEFHATLKAVDLLSEIITAKTLYILIDGALAGLALYAPLYEDFWAAIYQKVNSKYRGIGQMLYREKAKKMREYKFFTNGDDAMDSVLAKHKEELCPIRKERYFLVETGEVRSVKNES